MEAQLQELKKTDKEIQLLVHTAALLQWDQETGMPAGAVEERSDQLALLEGMIHDRLTAPRVGELLKKVMEKFGTPGFSMLEVDENAPIFFEKAFLRSFGRNYERAAKLPRRWVTEMAQKSSRAQAAWVEARRNDNFPEFQPHLEELLRLTMEKAEILGYPEHPYDALLDEFEPEMRTGEVARVFNELQAKLKPLVGQIAAKEPVDDSFRYRTYPADTQREFSSRILREMGYDFDRGRLDESAHPFTTSLGGKDVRVTTRYNEQDLFNALFGSIHEGGHALYEMGIDENYHGSVLGEGTSLGIHESQSRTWENLIGRSVEFWNHYFPVLKKDYFPEQLSDIDLEHFIRGVNKVEPSLIRINADELTYSLHVILRFELEVALVSGDLKVRDLPAAWNEGMKRLLGVTPDSDAKGVLQDVHWSMGAIGYFPTYALGNLFGAQFFKVLREDIPEVDREIARGKLRAVREWQGENIHRYGSSLTATELCGKISGEDLNPEYFIQYLEKKFGNLNDL